MCRIALRLFGVLAAVLAAGALLAGDHAESEGSSTLQLKADAESGGSLAWSQTAGGIYNYWGQITGDASGSYRATCASRPGTADTRIACSVLLIFGDPSPGNMSRGNMVLHGAVEKPQGYALFAHASGRPLVVAGAQGVTGASGEKYSGQGGKANVLAGRKISIELTS